MFISFIFGKIKIHKLKLIKYEKSKLNWLESSVKIEQQSSLFAKGSLGQIKDRILLTTGTANENKSRFFTRWC